MSLLTRPDRSIRTPGLQPEVMHQTPQTVPECLVLADMLESYLIVENGGWVDERDVHLIGSLVRGLEGLAAKVGAS